MNKEVTLKLIGIHKSEGEENVVESTLPGNYYYKDDKHFVLAREINDGVKTDTRLVLNKDSLVVRKAGEITSELVFEIDKRNPSTYITPFGHVEIETHTYKYQVDLSNAENGVIKGAVAYKLYVEGELQDDTSLSFEVTNR